MSKSSEQIITSSPEETFALGERIGSELRGGEVLLLTGGLGAGKTLLTKGILNSLAYDVDEVTSPSFALVNLYKTARFHVYHIDLWRTEGADPSFSVGLEEILDDATAVVIVEWAERLGDVVFDRPTLRIDLQGDGDDPRTILVRRTEQNALTTV